MAMTISTIDDFQEYLEAVSGKANHHAKNVSEVALCLAGAVVMFKDKDSEIKIMAVEGEKGNMMWVTIGGTRYALSYDHKTKSVLVKEGGIRGPVITSFNNASTAGEVIAFFGSLTQNSQAAGV